MTPILLADVVMAAPVGHVNILNGQTPSEAFTIDRKGTTVAPKEASTPLDEGDKVAPSPGAVLVFNPVNTSRPPVDIRGEFVATACPDAKAGLIDQAYEFVNEGFLADPSEPVDIFAPLSPPPPESAGGDAAAKDSAAATESRPAGLDAAAPTRDSGARPDSGPDPKVQATTSAAAGG